MEGAWALSHPFHLCRELTEINRRHITESVNSIRRVSEPHLSSFTHQKLSSSMPGLVPHCSPKAPNAFPPGTVPAASGACIPSNAFGVLGGPDPLPPWCPQVSPLPQLNFCPPLQLEEAQKQRHERLMAGQQQVLQQLAEEEPKVRPGRRKTGG